MVVFVGVGLVLLVYGRFKMNLDDCYLIMIVVICVIVCCY